MKKNKTEDFSNGFGAFAKSKLLNMFINNKIKKIRTIRSLASETADILIDKCIEKNINSQEMMYVAAGISIELIHRLAVVTGADEDAMTETYFNMHRLLSQIQLPEE